MKHALKCITGQKSSRASVVDGKLILSFPKALKPVVWQMDLSEAKSSALEIHEKKDEFTLTLKTQKGELIDIAPFGTHEEALDSLMAVSRALENAHGQIRPANSSSNNAHGTPVVAQRRKGGLMPLFLGLVLLAVLFFVWVNVTHESRINNLAAANLDTPASTAAAANEPGVPVSADDFLRNR